MKKTKAFNKLNKAKTVISVSGYARAGKDTFSDALEYVIGKNISVKKFKFAESLRNSIKLSFDYLNIKTSPWTELESEKKELRPLLIALGEYARSKDLDIFANATASQVEICLKEFCDIAIITDLRYQNENRILSELCKKNGYNYHRVHIVRLGNRPASIVEEQSVALLLGDGVDVQYVANDGDLEMIKSFAVKCVNVIKDKHLNKSNIDVT